VPGNKYDWNIQIVRSQPALKVEAADPRQPDIKDYAARHVGPLPFQKLLRRTE
jgi:hypothetical protein